MADSRMRLVLAAGLMFIMTALTVLQTLADAGIELDLDLPEIEAVVSAVEGIDDLAPGQTPEPEASSFAERLAAAGSAAALMAESPDGWAPVAPGVDYALFVEPGPNNVHVARMARANPELFLETGLADGTMTEGFERTSDMFERYEGAINYWGSAWGGTNDVLVAINGSFYDVNGVPDRGMVHSGWYAKRFTENQNGSGFVWKLDRTAFIGQCVDHNPAEQVLTFITDGGTTKYQGINVPRGDDEVIVYTPQYADSTGSGDGGVEFLVRMDRPSLILPPPAMAEGSVVEIRDQDGDSPLYFDHIVLSALGLKEDDLLDVLQVGDRVGISSSLANFEADDCVTPLAVDWTKAYASLGGSYYFLQDGEITSPGPTPANPLTAIAFNDDFMFFIVVDGRDPGISVGMTIDELAGFVKNTLGAEWAINQDGGGSSTMVIDGVVVNTPSDLSPVECKVVYLPIVIQGEGGEGAAADGESDEAELPECLAHTERAVANAIMMVAYRPPSLSAAFLEGQDVIVLADTTMRLGPGSNYAAFDSAPGGAEGTIAVHPGGINGVFAKDAHWWLVDFGSVVGWVEEDVLGPTR